MARKNCSPKIYSINALGSGSGNPARLTGLAGIGGNIAMAPAHIETKKFAAVFQFLRAGDQPGALRQWGEIEGLIRLLFAQPRPAGVKHWLWRQGLIASPELRLPMTGVSASLAERIDADVGRAKRR